MEGKLILGKKTVDEIDNKTKEEILKLKNSNIELNLCILRIGENPDDLAYERSIIKKNDKLGINTTIKKLDKNIKLIDLKKEIKKVNDNNHVHGILIFRPLPKHIKEYELKNLIDPNKDIDCFNPLNMAKIIENDDSGFKPCTPEAVIEILKSYDITISGKNIAIVGRSLVVGKPLAMMLLNEDATVCVCHSKTKNIKEICKRADILIAALGKSKYIDKEYIKENAVVIDVGINLDENNKLCGDVDFDDVIKTVSKITPVPRGVGAVTTSILARNVLKAYYNNINE